MRPELDPAKFCSHGKAYKTRCIDCELIMANERLTQATTDAQQYGKLVAKLEAEKQLQAKWENGNERTDVYQRSREDGPQTLSPGQMGQ